MKYTALLLSLLSTGLFAQRIRHEGHSSTHSDKDHSHLAHIQAYRQETAYVPNLPAPQLLQGIGISDLQIETHSQQAQAYFSQGVALLHCFWDFEAYRAFKEAIRHDSMAVMPYWGLYSAIGAIEGDEFKPDQDLARRKLEELKEKATEHEKLYAEGILARDLEGENSKKVYQQKLELIIHKYPQDTDAKLFLALSKMGGYDTQMIPREGQLYAEYLLRDLLKTNPDNAASHHYWIHLMENCCPEEAAKSAELLPQLAPASGHMVHMPGHVYYKQGNYQKAYESFTASLALDSAYMKQQGIPEVDTWNYIHNINYLLSNCAEDGRYRTALYYAEKLEKMPATKERKKKYEGRFFYQGVIAPAKMELCFGFYKKAADRLKAIQPGADSLYSTKATAYKEALFYFASGMDAVKRNKLDEAKKYSDALDASLWRNSHQFTTEDIIASRRLNDLNVASLELQGLIKGLENKYEEAVAFLNKAKHKEDELGYSEPPSYARPVLISLGEIHLKAGQYQQAANAYEELLKRHPNSANGLWGLYKVYKKQGNVTKAKTYASQLTQIIQFGDKSLYPL
jgi:tetratricopeptide (TPR) repeat protein